MNTHRTDKVSLTFGVLFLIAALWWLLGSQIQIALPTAAWFLAGGLILFGVLGLVGSIRPRNRHQVSPANGPLDEITPGPDPW
jgi:hypothetical protein